MILTKSAWKNPFKTISGLTKIVILLLVLVFIRLFAQNHSWVERFYTYGFYPVISRFLRILFGWVPFSLGDLLYLSAFFFVCWKIVKYIRIFFRLKVTWRLVWYLLQKVITFVLVVYIVFNVLWGLNYDRKGIASQLQLDVKPYTTQDLAELATVLQQRLNDLSLRIDSLQRLGLNKNDSLFQESIRAYRQVKQEYPFLAYPNPSLKPSIYSHIGQYFGFTGYYNPFSGEAQLKTTVPVFLKPFIITHEIGHQLGYGKENEANFVGYLACKKATNVNFPYSVYFELSLYALSDLKRRDSMAVKQLRKQWTPRVQHDYIDYLKYIFESENPVEPYIMRFYDQYLKFNNQPNGNRTYNEVIAWLIAYMKKFGKENV